MKYVELNQMDFNVDISHCSSLTDLGRDMCRLIMQFSTLLDLQNFRSTCKLTYNDGQHKVAYKYVPFTADNKESLNKLRLFSLSQLHSEELKTI
jgi:hypothetical protein